MNLGSWLWTGFHKLKPTFPETNSEFAPENPWLEDDISFWGGLKGLFSGAVSYVLLLPFFMEVENGALEDEWLVSKGATFHRTSQGMITYPTTPKGKSSMELESEMSFRCLGWILLLIFGGGMFFLTNEEHTNFSKTFIFGEVNFIVLVYVSIIPSVLYNFCCCLPPHF